MGLSRQLGDCEWGYFVLYQFCRLTKAQVSCLFTWGWQGFWPSFCSLVACSLSLSHTHTHPDWVDFGGDKHGSCAKEAEEKLASISFLHAGASGYKPEIFKTCRLTRSIFSAGYFLLFGGLHFLSYLLFVTPRYRSIVTPHLTWGLHSGMES